MSFSVAQPSRRSLRVDGEPSSRFDCTSSARRSVDVWPRQQTMLVPGSGLSGSSQLAAIQEQCTPLRTSYRRYLNSSQPQLWSVKKQEAMLGRCSDQLLRGYSSTSNTNVHLYLHGVRSSSPIIRRSLSLPYVHRLRAVIVLDPSC